MNFWKIFNSKNSKDSSLPSLYYKLKESLNENDDQKLIYLACMCGLIARMIHLDLKIEKQEIEKFEEIIGRYFSFTNIQVKKIVEISISEIEEFIDRENQLYSQPMRDILNESQKYNLIQMLFELAASDGVVSNLESEEIKLITKNIQLSDQHFLSARAKYKDKLGALKN